MERLTNKREADAQRKDYENRIKNGYPRNIPEERFPADDNAGTDSYKDVTRTRRKGCQVCNVGK